MVVSRLQGLGTARLRCRCCGVAVHALKNGVSWPSRPRRNRVVLACFEVELAVFCTLQLDLEYNVGGEFS